MIFWKRVNELMKARDISRKRLAIDLKISDSTIGKGIKNEAFPSLELARKIAEYLCVTLDYLCCEQVSLECSDACMDVINRYTINPSTPKNSLYEMHKNDDILYEINSLPLPQQESIKRIIHSLCTSFFADKDNPLLQK